MAKSEELVRAERLRDELLSRVSDTQLKEGIKMLFQRAYHAGAWDKGDEIMTKRSLWRD